MFAQSPAAPSALDRPGVGRQTVLRWTRPLALALLAFVVGLAIRTDPRPGLHGTRLLALTSLLAVIVGGTVLLVGRRGRPLPTAVRIALMLVLTAGSGALVWIEPNGPGYLGGFLAAIAAASRMPRRAGGPMTAVVLVVLGVASIAGAHRPLMSIVMTELGALSFFRLGRYALDLHERTEQSEQLLAELERNRAAQLRAATLAERQRLAREMHDVLAHSLSGLLLHLEGARLMAVRDGVNTQLADTIERAHHLAEAGLGEARQAIGMLRGEDLPGPERLPALAEQFERDSGVRARLTVCGSPTALGPQSRLAVYRVAQEALTNVRKHAHPDRVEVRLRYEPAGVGLTVEDFGAGSAPPAPADDHGYGVSGMRERAELLGGTLEARPTDTGFRVALWVPA